MNIWTFETLICESSYVKFILVHFLVLVQPYGKYYWSQSESSVLIEMVVCIHSLIFIFTCPRPQLSLVAPMLNNVSVHDCHGMSFFLVPHLASQYPDVFDGVIAEDGVIGITAANIKIIFLVISSWNSQQNTWSLITHNIYSLYRDKNLYSPVMNTSLPRVAPLNFCIELGREATMVQFPLMVRRISVVSSIRSVKSWSRARGVFSNTIKLMLERQKSALYQQEML